MEVNFIRGKQALCIYDKYCVAKSPRRHKISAESFYRILDYALWSSSSDPFGRICASIEQLTSSLSWEFKVRTPYRILIVLFQTIPDCLHLSLGYSAAQVSHPIWTSLSQV